MTDLTSSGSPGARSAEPAGGSRGCGVACGSSGYISKGLGKTRLAKDSVGSVTTRDADRDREVSLGDRAMPDFVTAAPLSDKPATGGSEQLAKGTIELRRHQAAAGSASRNAVI